MHPGGAGQGENQLLHLGQIDPLHLIGVPEIGDASGMADQGHAFAIERRRGVEAAGVVDRDGVGIVAEVVAAMVLGMEQRALVHRPHIVDHGVDGRGLTVLGHGGSALWFCSAD